MSSQKEPKNDPSSMKQMQEEQESASEQVAGILNMLSKKASVPKALIESRIRLGNVSTSSVFDSKKVNEMISEALNKQAEQIKPVIFKLREKNKLLAEENKLLSQKIEKLEAGTAFLQEHVKTLQSKDVVLKKANEETNNAIGIDVEVQSQSSNIGEDQKTQGPLIGTSDFSQKTEGKKSEGNSKEPVDNTSWVNMVNKSSPREIV